MKAFFKKFIGKFWFNYFSEKEKVVLFGLFLFGIGVRIFNAAVNQYWRDEVFIFFVTREHSVAELFLQIHWDASHPAFYYIFIHFWQKLSINPFFLRLPSIVASAIGLYFVPILAKELAPKLKFLPTVLLFLFSTSLPQIYLGLQAEPYAFEIPLVIVSLVYFFKLLKRETSTRNWVTFAFVNYLVFINDYSGVWLLGTYGLFILIFYLRQNNKLREVFLKAFLLTFMLSLSWLPIFITNFRKSLSVENVSTLFSNGNPFINNLFQTNFFVGSVPKNLFTMLGVPDLTWNLLLLVFAILGIYFLWQKNRKYAYFFLLGIFSPVTISFAFSNFVSVIFVSRNLFLVNVLITIGYAFSLSFLFAKHRTLAAGMVVLFLFNFAYTLVYPRFYYNDPPYDWAGVARYIKSKDNGRENFVLTQPRDFYPLEALTYYALVYNVNLKVINPSQVISKYGGKDYFKDKNLYLVGLESTNPALAELNYSKVSKEIGCKNGNTNFYLMYVSECDW